MSRISLTPRHFRSVETGTQLRLQHLRACQIMSKCRNIVRFLSEPIPIRKYRLYHRSIVLLQLIWCDANNRSEQIRFSIKANIHRREQMATATQTIQNNETNTGARANKMDLKFEIVVIPVSDVDRAKDFYANLGWRL